MSSSAAPPSNDPTIPSDLKSRIASSYDAIATTYNAFTIQHNPIRTHYLSLLLSHLNLPERTTDATTSNVRIDMLELGCGAGNLSIPYLLSASPSIHILGNDISSAQISLARTNIPQHENSRVSFIHGDMTTLSLTPSTYTAVIALYSIMHLPRAEQSIQLQKATTWLTPGGYLLANFGAGEMEGGVNERWLGEENGWMFWSGWGVEGTKKMVEDAGLEILVDEVKLEKEDEVDKERSVEFFWVLARKPISGE
ncbi:S-adenosyl-L-methionine-dependent methyltransferase [Clohesyomyces aquaticus]|uniref:S-adenosyl-L-methionine-dependent methyltransferase n=1 Tax=Clohesyomyces aquaticus TaxID=1231657 RepID=A0A1Y1ZYI8_9PLEO|nr:S-adenosyl-L-methionine-dependent methyltransferase [Clohesyomyces aquaticus]